MDVTTIPIDCRATNIVLPTQSPGRRPLVDYDVLQGVLNRPVANPRTVETRELETAFPSTSFGWMTLFANDLIYICQTRADQVHPFDAAWTVRAAFAPPTESHFRELIMQAGLPAKWILKGTPPPTVKCRELAYDIWKSLYKKFGLLPVRISASVESGITLSYRQPINRRVLVVEVYNDLEVATLVNDASAIVYSEDVKDLDFDSTFLNFNV